MKTTYRKLYKFHTKALAEDWLIKKNPQDVYDFYIIDEDKFYYNVIEDKKLIPQSGVGAVTVSENGVAKGNTSNVDFIDGDNTTFDVVKDNVSGKVKVKVNASGGGGNSTKSFPKHTSLTVADVGKLAMNKLFVINEPPQSFADVEYKAVVADTTPAVEGIKGVYKLSFDGLKLVEPVTKLIKIEFTNQPNDGDYLYIKDENDMGLFLFYYRDILISSNNIQIGVDLAETISNTITFFISNIVAIVESSDANSITFNMMLNSQDDSIKYFNESNIVIGPGSSDVYTITTERELTIDAASKAQAIYNLQNNYLLQNNNGRTLIDYASIFRNDSGQPNGTLGAFGLKYFANDSEVIDALNWALLNTTGNYFSSIFDIVTPLAYNGGTEKYEIVITNKTAPTSSGNTNFQNNNQQGVEVETSTVSGAELGSPEKIGYAIIGKIVGVDGDNVLIDKSQMYDLTMHADANGVIPATADFNSADYLVAWKGGTVIDLQRFKTIMNDAGVNENDAYRLMTTVSGFFTPLSKGLPSGLVTCEKTTFV